MQFKTIAAFRAGLLATSVCLLLPAPSEGAEEIPLRDLLRDGLFAEEVSRDPEAAAKRYQELLGRYAEDRDFAAVALFRLAEVRRKQDRKEESMALYQKLLAEFPSAVNETKLARENLVALGGKPPEPGVGAMDPEAREVARLQAAAKSSPDALVDDRVFDTACRSGWAEVVKMMLAAGCDPFGGSALSSAAGAGHLEIVRLLLAGDATVPGEVVKETFGLAIASGRLAVLRFLLEKGLKPGMLPIGDGDVPALFYALRINKLQCAEVLLEHGAELDAVSEFRSPPITGNIRGTALHLAISYQDFDSMDWLLNKGAKPDLPSMGDQLTPLHCALVLHVEESLPVIEKLLAAGADPNAATSWNPYHRDGGTKEADGSTVVKNPPLVIAIASGFKLEQKIDILLKHGAKPAGHEKEIGEAVRRASTNQLWIAGATIGKLLDAGASAKGLDLLPWAMERKDLPLVRRLLAAGAPADSPLVMARAINSGVPEILNALLDSGADPNMELGELPEYGSAGHRPALFIASIDESLLHMLELLVRRGAKPDESWVKGGFNNACPAAQQYLTRMVMYPVFAAKQAITFQSYDPTKEGDEQNRWLELVNAAAGDTVPDFARLMLANGRRFPNHGKLKDRSWPEDLVLIRRDAQGEFRETRIEIDGKEPYPVLAWGDIIRQEQEEPDSIVDRDWPDKLEWALRKRVAFSITVEIEGKAREIQMRGDRVIFDPTKDEVPLCDPQALILWLCPQVKKTFTFGSSESVILVKRKDWPEVRLVLGSNEASNFRLKAGDQIKFEIPETVRQQLIEERRRTVSFLVPGMSFRHDIIGVRYGKSSPLFIPTLIQALVDLQVPHDTDLYGWARWSGRTTLDAEDLAKASHIFSGFTLLPHPDLSKIRIRRLLEDGNEQTMEVDLEKVMAPDASVEAARNADVLLQCGDVVEIPLKNPSTAGPWKGFAQEVNTFFAKALSGKVQLSDPDANVAIWQIDYQPLRFIETEIGLIPGPPSSGVPSVTGQWISGRPSGTFSRAGVPRADSFSSTNQVFVRDGDVYRDDQGGPSELRSPLLRLGAPQSR